MARKRVEEVIAEFESWDDVNQALGTIGDNQRMVEGFEAEMQEKIDAAKAEAEAKSRIYLEGTKRLEAQICAFAETHRDDMDGTKSKTLNFGSVGFRKSTRITLPKAPAKLAEIVRQLLERGMSDCVKQAEPKIDKGILGKYPPADIIAVGAGVKVLDTFWYEPDREKLERN